MAKRRNLSALKPWHFGLWVVWLTLGFLASASSGEGRKYRIQSEAELATARKAVLSELAPLLSGVLEEAGLPEKQVTDLCERFGNQTIVCGGDAQIEYNYARATEILAALPKDVHQKFLRLSYQWTGPSCLWRDEVVAALALEPAQQRQVEAIVIDYLEQLAPANRSDFSYDATAAQNAAYGRRTVEIEEERDRHLLDILTPAQRQAWQDLIGPPSKALRDFRDYCAKYNPQ